MYCNRQKCNDRINLQFLSIDCLSHAELSCWPVTFLPTCLRPGDTWIELHGRIDNTKHDCTEASETCGQFCHTPMFLADFENACDLIFLCSTLGASFPCFTGYIASPLNGIDLPRCSVCFQWSQSWECVQNCRWAYKIAPQFAGHSNGHEILLRCRCSL